MDSVDIKVYTDFRSPRLEYIAGLILSDILGLSIAVIDDRRRIGSTPVISYSSEGITGSFRIAPSGFLSETGVRKFEPEGGEWQGVPVLFPHDGDSHLPFDIFSAAFYMVSRYEEYLDFSPDDHGRFRAEESYAFRHGFLTRPVVEIWAAMLTKELIRHYPFLAFRRNKFRSLATFDIDQAYAYRGKGIIRGAAGLLRDVARGAGGERLRSLSGSERDPYDVYDYLFETIDRTGTEALFFLPFGSWSEFDKNNTAGSRLYRELIGTIQTRYKTGIHFSYNSGRNPDLMAREAERYSRVTGARPLLSRQHYLLLDFPVTYQNLIKNSIAADYTMGFASSPGFRAGISRQFHFYDIAREQATGLLVSPFVYMDVTLRDYMKLGAAEATDIIGNLIEEVRSVGGTFISLWHNSSLTERDGWEGWRQVFEDSLKKSISND